jgi:hypothetical protein
MALTFKDVSSFALTSGELKNDVKAMGKKIAAKEEMSFFLVTNYVFKDKKTGILLMIGKPSECKNAFKQAKAFANGLGKKLAGTPLVSIIVKKNLMWGTARYVTDEVTGKTFIEFEKNEGAAKPSLIMRQLDKNPWIKGQEFECRFTGSEEEIEGTDEGGIEGEQPTTPVTEPVVAKAAPQVGNLGGYWSRISKNYAELQKTKSKEVAAQLKADGLKFQEFFNLALPEEKTQFQSKYDQVGKIFQILGVSTGSTATATADTPERKAAKDQNKISKAKIDELLKSVNLDELYKLATA